LGDEAAYLAVVVVQRIVVGRLLAHAGDLVRVILVSGLAGTPMFGATMLAPAVRLMMSVARMVVKQSPERAGGHVSCQQKYAQQREPTRVQHAASGEV
jgi:hypothetical protein